MGSLNLFTTAQQRARAAALPPEADDDGHDLVAQIGSEVAAVLSRALERVHELAATGRIDRASLRALCDEIERARRVGMMGQQVTRVASGRFRLTPERLDLAVLLRQALQQRLHEMDARGIEVRQTLRPADVTIDAALGFSLLQALLDWAFEHARSRVDVEIDQQSWPPQSRLSCSFAYRPADEVTSEPAPLEPPLLGTVSWRLLERTALTLGLRLVREDRHGRTRATIGFPRSAGESIEGLSTTELGARDDAGLDAMALAGSHVLVISSQREVRNLVREALRPLGLMVDFATTVAEAHDFCRDGLPHAIVHESGIGGADFDALRREVLALAPKLGFIEICEDAKAFEVLRVADREVARVGLSAIVESLPAALVFELSRSG